MISLVLRAVAWILLWTLLMQPAFAAKVHWLSDTPPDRESAKRLRDVHGGPVLVGRDGAYTKMLWLREGEDIEQSPYIFASQLQLLLMDPEGKIKETTFEGQKHSFVAFKMPDEGFYNLYMIEKSVDQETLNVKVAKAEALKHNCREGHDDMQAKMPPKHFDAAQFEIIRERLPKEDFHTRITSGDTVSFLVLYRGKPAGGATVKLITQKGWSKSIKTDQEGRAAFMMIRDYYPPWEEFDRHHRESFLAVADYVIQESGSHEGSTYQKVHCQATMQVNYYPSPRDYQSYLYGLLVGLFAMILAGAGIYVYRKKGMRA